MERTTIKLDATIFGGVVYTFLISFIIVFIIMHFGDLKYKEFRELDRVVDLGNGIKRQEYVVNREMEILSFHFHTPFKTEHRFTNNGWRVMDLDMGIGDFYKHKYANMFRFYIGSTIRDFKFVLVIWSIMFLGFYLHKKVNVKLVK